MAKLLIGREVTWSSQAQGSLKTKTGVIRGFLPGNVPAYTRERLKKENLSHLLYSRAKPCYLVEVERYHKRTGEKLKSKWYTPYVSVVDAQNP